MHDRIYLVSIDETRNRHRWYRVTAEVSLFGGLVIREWGRLGQKGRRLERPCASYADAVAEVRRVLRLRERHGYLPAVDPRVSARRRAQVSVARRKPFSRLPCPTPLPATAQGA